MAKAEQRAHINGRDLTEDFWDGRPQGAVVREYRKTATVLALPLVYPAEIATPEGTMLASAGDYLVTDKPPTHAWPVRRDVFESTYVEVPPRPELPQHRSLADGNATDALETAWGIIANASGGDWTKQSEEWRGAAERWRDAVLPRLSSELSRAAREGSR